MATLPSYAKIVFSDYAQKRESALLRTEMETGPPRQVKIRSRPMVTRSVKFFIKTLANFQAFEAWYKDDLVEGSSWFNFTDPVSHATIQARFVGGGYTAKPVTPLMEAWEIAVNIESWG